MKRIFKTNYKNKMLYLKMFGKLLIILAGGAVLLYAFFRAMFYEFPFEALDEGRNVLRSIFIGCTAAFVITFLLWTNDAIRFMRSKKELTAKPIIPSIPGFAVMAALLLMTYGFIF